MNNTYWMPNTLPEFTESWNELQSKKKYLTPEKVIREHPKWFYENKSYVCDEYLYQNENWKLIIDNYPELPEQVFPVNEKGFLCGYPEEFYVEKLDINSWIMNEKTCEVLYEVYKIKEEKKPVLSFDEECELLKNIEDSTIDKKSMTLTRHWKINKLSTEQVRHKLSMKYREFRTWRDYQLLQTDFSFVYAMEKSISVSDELKIYRQKLRDLTQIFSEDDVKSMNLPEDLDTWNRNNIPEYSSWYIN